jgi:hypothetical protein
VGDRRDLQLSLFSSSSYSSRIMDSILDIALLESPYGMMVSVDRSGVICFPVRGWRCMGRSWKVLVEAYVAAPGLLGLNLEDSNLIGITCQI